MRVHTVDGERKGIGFRARSRGTGEEEGLGRKTNTKRRKTRKLRRRKKQQETTGYD